MTEINHTFAICAYKESKYLEACIQSVLNQTIPSQVIITTGTKNTFIENLGQQYDIPVFSYPGGGIGKDWNFALSKVETPYVTLAHQDDVYQQDYWEKCAKAIELNPNFLLAFTDYDELKNEEVVERTRNLKIKSFLLKPIKWAPQSRWIRNRSLAFGNSICCPAVTYNLSQLKGFKFDTTLSSNLDWLAWYEISQKKGSFLFIDKVGMYHRIHEESETSNAISNNKRTEEDAWMFRKYWPNFVVKGLMFFYIRSQKTN